MQSAFSEKVKENAIEKATLLTEVFVNQIFSENDIKNLTRNMQSSFFESAMRVADDIYTDAVKRNVITDIGCYSYDQIISDTDKETIEISAKRAAATIPIGTKVEGAVETAIINAIAIEYTYLWLKAIEPFYKRFPEAV